MRDIEAMIKPTANIIAKGGTGRWDNFAFANPGGFQRI
jgi:hypothetical protein